MKIPHIVVSFDQILRLSDSLFFIAIVEELDILLVYGKESDSVLIVLNPPYLVVSSWLMNNNTLSYNSYKIRSKFQNNISDFRLLVCDIELPDYLETYFILRGGHHTSSKELDRALYLVYSMPGYLVTHDINYDINCGFIKYIVNNLLTSICLSLGIPETFYNKLRNLIRWIR